MEHNLQRPQWTCHADGGDWPCELDRKLLREAYPDADDLARYMLGLVVQAALELGVPEAKLYRRFVAWTLPEGRVCRVCGRAGHDVLAGVPPRLFPCDGYAIEPLIRTKDR
jgi:hypothetical protein